MNYSIRLQRYHAIDLEKKDNEMQQELLESITKIHKSHKKNTCPDRVSFSLLQKSIL